VSMRARSTCVVGVLLAAVAVLTALTQSEMADYVRQPGWDNPEPFIAAMSHGHLAAADANLPLMGGVSLLWRVPFAALAGSSLVWAYRLGALACLLVVVALAVVVDRRLAARGDSILRRLLTGMLLAAGPTTFAALNAGHPEELLGGALCVLAVIAAAQDRRIAAALLLGLAVGTKQWALLAVPPVVLSLRGGRVGALALATGVAALFVLPEVLVSPSHYAQLGDQLGATRRVYPTSLWWAISAHASSLSGGDAARTALGVLPRGLTRSFTSTLTLALAAGMTGLLALTRRRPDPLALLAGLLALRCALDPINLEYYLAPAMLAAVTWDALSGPRDGPPLVALALTAATALAWSGRVLDASPTLAFAGWALATLPLFALAVPAPRLVAALRPAVQAPLRRYTR
jgi:hypothetical protein